MRSRAVRLWLAGGCVAGIAVTLWPSGAFAQVARVEIHTFASTTLTDQELLTGKKEGKPVVLAGELRIPKPGTERLPAVVLVHGSGGISGYVDDWVPKLNALGVATFVFDSFTPRGIVNTINDQDQLGRLVMMVDAYRALALLAKHPRVDPERIALMGFSRGASSTLFAAVKRFQQMQSTPGAAFTMFIAFYPSCTTKFLHGDEVVGRPVRIFHGGADDWNPVEPCREWVERVRKAGVDVRLMEYPGAQHVFDWAALKAPMKFPQAETTRHCRVEEISEGRLVNAETKRPYDSKDPCVEHGATAAYSAEASADAQRAVSELVNTVLKSK